MPDENQYIAQLYYNTQYIFQYIDTYNILQHVFTTKMTYFRQHFKGKQKLLCLISYCPSTLISYDKEVLKVEVAL